MVSTRVEQLEEIIAPAVAAVGFDLWGIEYLPHGESGILRVYIDHENGIEIEDCVKASRQISAVMDVEDPIKNEYNLEVSSPGMERPLFKPAHYQAFCGDQIAVKVFERVNKLRKVKGELLAVDEDGVEIAVDGEPVKVAFNNIAKANVVANF